MTTLDRVELFPVRLPVIRSFSFASDSAGTVGAGAPHLFVKITDSDGRIGRGRRPARAAVVLRNAGDLDLDSAELDLFRP